MSTFDSGTFDSGTFDDPLAGIPYSSIVLATPGLIDYWRLGEVWGTIAADAKGLNPGGYHGDYTLAQPGALPTDADKSILLNGTGYVSVVNDLSLNVGDVFTVEAWIKRHTIGTSQVIVTKQAGAYTFWLTGDALGLNKSGSGTIAVSTNTITDTRLWHHVVVTKNGAAVHLYVDGIDVTGTVTNQTIVDNTSNLVIGQAGGGTQFFNGGIDEVALYNVDLSAAIVKNHYAAGMYGTTSPGATVTAISDGNTPTLEARAKSIARAIPTSDIFCYLGDVYSDGNATAYNGASSGLGFDGAYGDEWNVVSPNGQNLIPEMVHCLGNHEYHAANATTLRPDPTDTFWTGANTFGSVRTSRSKMSVDFTRNDLHAVYAGLDSETSRKVAAAQWSHANYYDLGGWRFLFLDAGHAGSDEGIFPSAGDYYNWVKARVNEVVGRHLVVFVHFPRYTSGDTHTEALAAGMDTLWRLVSSKAVAYISGHNHIYERQLARNQDGSLSESQDAGTVPIVQGMGGAGLTGLNGAYASSAAVALTSISLWGFGKLTAIDKNNLVYEMWSLGTDGLHAPYVFDRVFFSVVTGAAPLPTTGGVSTGTQPFLPLPVAPSEVERAFIEEQPRGLWPENQDSNFGIKRKIFCDELQIIANQLQLLEDERFPDTSTQFLAQHEADVGLTVNPVARTTLQRRQYILARYKRGAFTHSLRNFVIESYINAVLGGVTAQFTPSGIPLTSAGIPLHSGLTGTASQYYFIQEKVEQFIYNVWIDTRVALDTIGLTRELKRITPAGITFNIYNWYVKTGGAKSGGIAGGVKVISFVSILKKGGAKSAAQAGGTKAVWTKLGGGFSSAKAGAAKSISLQKTGGAKSDAQAGGFQVPLPPGDSFAPSEFTAPRG